MSNDVSFDELIDHLQNNPDASLRAEAAKIIGEMADDLDPVERKVAIDALNHAMRDPDPMVLMAAMGAMGAFSADEEPEDDDDDDEEHATLEAAVCPVCHRLEALLHPEDCEFDNCPYR